LTQLLLAHTKRFLRPPALRDVTIYTDPRVLHPGGVVMGDDDDFGEPLSAVLAHERQPARPAAIASERRTDLALQRTL
jgi:hypothetical protein